MRWKVRREFAPLLDTLLTTPATIVRASPVRTVTLHRLNGCSYFIKRYLIGRSPWRRLLFLVKNPPAEKQWAAGLRLERLGLPVVRSLACGARNSLRGLEESILITEGFEGVPLTELRMPDWSGVLRFLKEMHDRGVVQPDLHVGNLLACPHSGELRLIDFGHVQFKKRVSEAERLENLAFLALSAPIPLSPEVEELRQKLRRRVYRKRSRRCLKDNREFGRERGGRMTWRIRLPFLGESLRKLIEDPDRLLENGCCVLKAGRTTTIGCWDGLVLKRFNLVKAANIVKDLFRGSRAERSYRLAYHLELLGIPTARPVAFADRRKAGFPVSSFFVAKEITGARTLASLLDADQPIGLSVVRNLADLVAGLHNEGFSHRDLKATNLLSGPEGRSYLLDLDGLKFVDRMPERTAARNLMRLARAVAGARAVGHAQRLAFLRRYYLVRGLRRIPPSHRSVFRR